MEINNIVKKLSENPHKYRMRKVVEFKGMEKTTKCFLVVFSPKGEEESQHEVHPNSFGQVDKILYGLRVDGEVVPTDSHVTNTLPLEQVVVYDYKYYEDVPPIETEPLENSILF